MIKLLRCSAWLTAVLVLLAASSIAPANAATPAAAELIAPSDGAVAPSRDVQLSVRANDPDGGQVQVRFEGRRKGATIPVPGAGEPFTLVAIPDIQNYTYGNRQATIVQQSQWIVNSRNDLNTAMVVQLGDLVSNWDNATQWGHASTGMKVLDDAGVPNTVVAGNHDFNTSTGAHALYDKFFGPSRYANATWTPSTARYGGYLGQNLFGADPVDTQNMNNFALFSAGGQDFLVLNLEWEAPSYATEWATRVLRAYPDRTAIVVTHAFIWINGQRRTVAERPGGTAPEKLWTDFVSQNCQIKLVLNGHYHDGDAGEANRSDLNRCGEPVQQILTDYQSRVDGGSGWLRYYTFDPVTNTMAAKTFSPTLGKFETDTDSQFTVPFALSSGAQPAPFETIGASVATSGSVVTRTWTGLEPDTVYEWRAVTGDGTGETVSPSWQVRTPKPSDLVNDTFDRTVTGGWGAAPGGDTWQLVGTAGSFSVDGRAGRIVAPVGGTRTARQASVSVRDVAITADLALEPAASGSGTYVTAQARVSGSSSYRAKLRYLVGGAVNLGLARVDGQETTLASRAVPGLVVTPGKYLRLRFEVEGASPTTLRAKVWPRDLQEPASWMVVAADSASEVQEEGSVGLDVYPSSTAAGPATLNVDRYVATRLGAPPPANRAPSAVIGTPLVNERTVSVDGSGSTDQDGTIALYSWEFGDGSTGSGPTASHTYAADGTYRVRLTVRDDDGATDTATTTVTTTAPPMDNRIAVDHFDRTIASGWGVAQQGGRWTSASDSRYSVTSGTGNHVLSAPGRSAETMLSSVAARDVDLRASLAWSRNATAGTIYSAIVVRRQADGSDYRLKVMAFASGSLQLALARRDVSTEVVLRTVTVGGVSMAADTMYRVAFRTTTVGATTTLSAKLWNAAGAEPSSWAVATTDSSATQQRGGAAGFSSYLSSSATTAITMHVDDLELSDPTRP